MIPAIEDIFHALSRGDMSFDDAEKFVRGHIALTSDQDNMRDYFAAKAFQVRLAKYDDWTLTELAEQAY